MNSFVGAADAAAFLITAGAIARYRRRVRQLSGALAERERRESGLLEASRIVTAASRESSGAVLRAVHAAIAALDPAVDTVLVYDRDGEELVCTYAGGSRGAHFTGTRLRIDDERALPAVAAARRSSVEFGGALRCIVPTDRSAIAVPMEDAMEVQSVVYASAVHAAALQRDRIASCVSHAAVPFALAREREADRASATFDALTGLYAPRAFRQTLKEQLAAVELRGRSTLSLWFVDTDHFKRVNDTLGHRAGDAVLQRMAALLRAHTVEGVDVAARNGGDEFCAVLNDVEKTAAIERAQRFCEAVKAYDFGMGFALGASIGIASYPCDAHSAETLLEIADGAMYHSKRAGRSCVSFAVDGGFAVYR